MPSNLLVLKQIIEMPGISLGSRTKDLRLVRYTPTYASASVSHPKRPSVVSQRYSHNTDLIYTDSLAPRFHTQLSLILLDASFTDISATAKWPRSWNHSSNSGLSPYLLIIAVVVVVFLFLAS